MVKSKEYMLEESKGYIHDLTRLLFEWSNGSKKPTCYYCGREFPADMNGFANIAIEHRKSVHGGGENDMNNYVISCRLCNSTKGKKSFAENSEEERDFKKVRERAIKLDDEYVEKLYSYMQLKEYPGKKFLDDLLDELISDESFQNVKKYGKSDGFWIEWVTSQNEKWYFHLLMFELQPHFLIKNPRINDETIQEKLKDRLYSEGYYCDHIIRKYLPLFEEVWEGRDLLKQEMDKIRKICIDFNLQ